MAKTRRSLSLKLRTSYKGATKMVNSTLKEQNGQVFLYLVGRKRQTPWERPTKEKCLLF